MNYDVSAGMFLQPDRLRFLRRRGGIGRRRLVGFRPAHVCPVDREGDEQPGDVGSGVVRITMTPNRGEVLVQFGGYGEQRAACQYRTRLGRAKPTASPERPSRSQPEQSQDAEEHDVNHLVWTECRVGRREHVGGDGKGNQKGKRPADGHGKRSEQAAKTIHHGGLM